MSASLKFLAFLLCAAILLAAPPGAVAIRNARVTPVSGPALEHGTVVIRDGLIEAVGADVSIPADAWVIDGQGLTVYPGLIDALSTWGIPGAAPATPQQAPSPATRATPAQTGAEEPSVTNTFVRAADLVRPTDRRLEAARSAGFTTAVTFPMRGVFGGQGAVINLAGEKPGQMVIVPSVGHYVSYSTSFGAFPSSLMGVFALIRQTYLDAGHYRLEKARYAANPTASKRPDWDRALEGFLDTKRMLLPASRAVEIERTLKLASDLKDEEIVLYGLHEAYQAVDRLKGSGMPLLVSLKWPERNREADPDEIESLRVLELRDKAPSTPAALAKAGLRFAFYSDNTERPRDLMRAVKRAIDAGLTAEDAVRALTLSPAQIYGVADRLGSIEKGKIANLVVTSGDLFQEKTQVKYIFIDGVKYEPAPETGEETAR
jgi:imidazolonepropionase-like amidohydrolase